MNNKIILKYIGKVLIGFAILFIFPIIFSLIYKEKFFCFIVPQAIILIIGIIIKKKKINN